MKHGAFLLLLLFSLKIVNANYPLFDETTKMRLLLVPTDTRVGTNIYRLRATDSDYDFPLAFEVIGRTGNNIIRLETLPCSRNYSACEANVILIRSLRIHTDYNFRISVRDTRGDSTNIETTIRATNSSHVTSLDVAFPHYTTLVYVSENTEPGSELTYILVRKSDQHSRHAHIELMGSALFSVKEKLAGRDVSNGTIILNDELDYERQNLYPLTLHATDPYVTPGIDSRNILGFDIAIVVLDNQDTPPIFTHAPPVTTLPLRVKPGDVILQVHAEDGDKGQPREIRYGLLSEGNPFTPFFSINEIDGEVRLTRSLNELRSITQPGRPIIIRVLAEEIIPAGDLEYRDISSVAELAILLPGPENTAPYFESESYVASLPEGSLPGTPLIFTDPWMPRVRDNDMGLGAVFALSLQNDNGTFEVTPTVAEGSANFMIRVKNPVMLDFEKYPILTFKVLAIEVSQTVPLSASASVTVLLSDVNDNAPIFEKSIYTARIQENATAGTFVAQVQAHDVDSGKMGKLIFTRLIGQLNNSLNLDRETGRITVATNNHEIDREEAPEYRLYVEARDEMGNGQASTVPLIITVMDINDNSPVFEYPEYEFFLGPENKNFTTKIFLKATDADAEAPNNVIRYEIISGNVGEKFYLNEITGEMMVRPIAERRMGKRELKLERKEPSIYYLNIRAYDLGVPHRWSRTDVRVHSAESDPPLAGSVVFIVPKSPASVLADPKATEKFLAGLTGGRVTIREVRPYKPGIMVGAEDLSPGIADSDKSVVVALVTYASDPAIVDVAQMQQRLMANQTTNTVIVKEYRAESSALFWFLLFLALLLAMIIAILVICFIHSGCPLYYRRYRQTPRSAEEVRLVLERPPRDDSDKIVLRREAWSADGGTRRYLSFDRRNILTLDRPKPEDAPADGQDRGGRVHHQNAPVANPPGPNVIYSREFQQNSAPRLQREILIEDVHEGDIQETKRYGTRDSNRSIHTNTNIFVVKEVEPQRVMADESADEIDSMRRHELERGSDLGQARYIMRERTTPLVPRVVEVLTLDEVEANGREQHFVKDGNAEILRLMTRGKHGDMRRLGGNDVGKDIIMRRFMEDQQNHHMDSHVILPGQILHQMGTQTDEERGTQTDLESDGEVMTPVTPPNQMAEHPKHIIKTPILEENESSYEHMTPGKNNVREPSFTQVYDDEEDEDIDIPSIIISKNLDGQKQNKESNGKQSVADKNKAVVRSQSLPRSEKRSNSNLGVEKPLKQKSSSVTSLDKSSRVTFKSPDLSEPEDTPVVKRRVGAAGNNGRSSSPPTPVSKRRVGGVNNGRASPPTPVNKRRVGGGNNGRSSSPPTQSTTSSTGNQIKRKQNDPLKGNNNNTSLRRTQSNISLTRTNKSNINVKNHTSLSDDESNVTKKPTIQKKTRTNSFTGLPKGITRRKSLVELTEGENVKKSNSLRITKASSSRKSISPAPVTSRRTSMHSDGEDDRRDTVRSRMNSQSPLPKQRKVPTNEKAVRTVPSRIVRRDSNEATKSVRRDSNETTKSVRRDSNEATKSARRDSNETTTKTIRRDSNDTSKLVRRDSTTLKTANNKQGTSSKTLLAVEKKEKKRKEDKRNVVSESSDSDNDRLTPNRQAILSPSLIKSKSPTYQARVQKLEDELNEEGPSNNNNEEEILTLSNNNNNNNKSGEHDSLNSSNVSLQTVTNNLNITSEQANDFIVQDAPPRIIYESAESGMQTDVTLLPLINSMGRIDDDLDSGIAMTEGRSKRLNQLIEKKSIFTIAYDDMHTQQIRADSASPQC